MFFVVVGGGGGGVFVVVCSVVVFIYVTGLVKKEKFKKSVYGEMGCVEEK